MTPGLSNDQPAFPYDCPSCNKPNNSGQSDLIVSPLLITPQTSPMCPPVFPLSPHSHPSWMRSVLGITTERLSWIQLKRSNSRRWKCRKKVARIFLAPLRSCLALAESLLLHDCGTCQGPCPMIVAFTIFWELCFLTLLLQA